MTYGREKRLLLGAAAATAPIPLPFNEMLEWPTLALYLVAVALFVRRAASPASGERWLPKRSLNLLGLAYLILFGSVVAFSAYIWLLERCSATLVATHTYVNPVIAVLLGWLFAGERVTPRVIAATGLILSAVLLLKSSASRRAQSDEAPCPPPDARADRVSV